MQPKGKLNMQLLESIGTSQQFDTYVHGVLAEQFEKSAVVITVVKI